MQEYVMALPGNKELKNDLYYKFCMEYYYLFEDRQKSWFDKHKNYSFEKWAKYLARNKIPRCPSNEYQIDMVRNEIKRITFGEYSLALRYWGGFKCKIYIRHNSPKCNFNKFWVSANSFLNLGSRCPVCNESKGETKIRNFLKCYKIPFKSQYCFDDLVGKKNSKLKFDFAVFNKEGNLELLIEFDGIYHYETSNRSNEEKLKSQQNRDFLKDEYCKSKNINLLRIPYWEYKNINKILKENIL